MTAGTVPSGPDARRRAGSRGVLTRPDRRPYVAVGILLGLVNLVVNVLSLGSAPVLDLGFMLAALVLVSIIPVRPLVGIGAYMACWLLLVSLPNTYSTDMLVTNLAFLFFLGRFLPPWPATALCLGATLVQAVTASLHVDRSTTDFGTLLFQLIAAAVLLPVGALLRSSEHSRRAEAQRAGVRYDDLRHEIAREMHDLVAYSMSQTALRAQRASMDMSYPPEARQEFAALESTASDALHELRLLLRTLRQDAPTRDIAAATGLGGVVADLGTALRAISDDVAGSGFDVTFRSLGEAVPTRSQATTLSRVAREMGANIIRHADPREPVTITLVLGPESIRIVSTNRIDDEAHLPSSGTGMLGMRERLAAIDGTLTTLADSGWWIVTASVPVIATRPEPPALEKSS
ncbi:MAG: histidine kinase [Actinomyces sp.]|uniref:sensor histidine kinase n=1 Tax=Actinomyces sp. TaxID=29317 RepID=UPI0026DA7520|nr:histidine kinase [Actinomyces sp.]MDO4242724.1 histidine kinase [Actinomyces sp.]